MAYDISMLGHGNKITGKPCSKFLYQLRANISKQDSQLLFVTISTMFVAKNPKKLD